MHRLPFAFVGDLVTGAGGARLVRTRSAAAFASAFARFAFNSRKRIYVYTYSIYEALGRRNALEGGSELRGCPHPVGHTGPIYRCYQKCEGSYNVLVY